MADFLQNLRMNGIFNNGQSLVPPNLSHGINLDEISNLLNRIHGHDDYEGSHVQYGPNGPNANLGHIGQSMIQGPVNTQPDFKVDWGSGASEQFAKNILNPPERGLPFQKLAVDYGIKKEGLDIKREGNEQKSELGNRRADTGDWRASIAEFKAKNPSAKILAPKGGNFQLVNPVTHEVTDTGKSTGTMNDKDRMELANENAIEQITNRGAQQRETASETIKEKGEEARKTKQTPTGQSNLPTQQGRDQFNRAQELFNSDPELNKFIHVDPNTKTFTIDQPGTGFFGGATGPTKEQADKINQHIYGTSKTYSNKPKTEDKTEVKKDPLGIR